MIASAGIDSRCPPLQAIGTRRDRAAASNLLIPAKNGGRSMSLETSVLHTRVLKVTNASSLFERVVEGMLLQLRTQLGVPLELNPEDPKSEMIEWEFDQARQKLRAFGTDFAELYTSTLTRHIGAEHLTPVLSALEHDHVQRYLGAVASMEGDLTQGLEQLAMRMSAALQH